MRTPPARRIAPFYIFTRRRSTKRLVSIYFGHDLLQELSHSSAVLRAVGRAAAADLSAGHGLHSSCGDDKGKDCLAYAGDRHFDLIP